ncbi:NTF2-like protein [Patellaria atrata CBS 101060]|uniref:NTF2-like protein n=1 Tax=Patellaria atrata CBS 101060 TaxID=1346257 RepID=A0A9P4S3H6_9PEZI|nr:NTF2-like protein [Patellaria atrata CBS 101060]
MLPEYPPTKMMTEQTEEELRNIQVVKEYMRLAYSPIHNKGRETVTHLCHEDAYFIAPTTFPDSKSPQDYADSHAKVMASLKDLRIVSYDVVFAKGGHVALRYSAEGSHCGDPHNGIPSTGKKASWHASGIFEVEDGKIKGWIKEWDKLHMWKQLGWMKGNEYL